MTDHKNLAADLREIAHFEWCRSKSMTGVARRRNLALAEALAGASRHFEAQGDAK